MAATIRNLFSRHVHRLTASLSTLSRCNGSVRSIHVSSGASMQASLSDESNPPQVVTLLPGDGVWPELMEVVKKVFKSGGIPIQFEELNLSEVTPYYSNKMEDVVDSIKRNGICLKGIMAAANVLDKGLLENVNMMFRNELDLFANVVLVKSVPGLESKHGELDFVIIREQTEGEYSALEHESVKGVVESLKIVTRAKSRRIAKFAFDYATKHNRKKVTAVHKANIMKMGDGLFLECCREISELYPKIEFESMIVDNCCMQLVSNPHQFDVMVTPNLYGNIIDNIGAGLAGGAGVIPGESYSPEVAVFEPGARHSFGQAAGRNIANPTAILLCASNMLRHMNLELHANRVRDSVYRTIKDGKVRTRDMGGYATTLDYCLAVIDNMKH